MVRILKSMPENRGNGVNQDSGASLSEDTGKRMQACGPEVGRRAMHTRWITLLWAARHNVLLCPLSSDIRPRARGSGTFSHETHPGRRREPARADPARRDGDDQVNAQRSGERSGGGRGGGVGDEGWRWTAAADNVPMVEMKVVLNASSENRNSTQVLPTPESPISSSLNK